MEVGNESEGFSVGMLVGGLAVLSNSGVPVMLSCPESYRALGNNAIASGLTCFGDFGMGMSSSSYSLCVYVLMSVSMCVNEIEFMSVDC